MFSSSPSPDHFSSVKPQLNQGRSQAEVKSFGEVQRNTRQSFKHVPSSLLKTRKYLIQKTLVVKMGLM
jgi:hypothetical protein